MKRTISLFIAIAIMLSFTACGAYISSGDANVEAPSKADGNSTDVVNPIESSSPVQATNDIPAPAKNEISFTEVIVVDNDECSIKITGIDPDNIWGYTLKALFENKSTDKTYMFSVESAAINGVQCDPLFAAEVAGGKKSNNDINFSTDKFEKNGVGDYTDIELTFRVYDSNDWLADPVAYESIHIYPYGEDKAVQFVREAQPNDTVIVDNDSVTVIVTGYEDDSILGYTVNLFLLNKTDKNIMFTVDEVSVNGFMADPFYATTVSAGKCAFSSMSWSDTTFEENGITAVEEIEFKLRAYDSDDFMADDFANEVITLKP